MSQRVCLKLALAEAFSYAIQATSQEESFLPFQPIFIHPPFSQKKSFYGLNANHQNPTGAQPFVPQGLCDRIRGRLSLF